MKKLRDLLAVLAIATALVGVPATAMAKDDPRPASTKRSKNRAAKNKAAKSKTASKPIKKLDFLGDKLQGELVRPGGDTATAAGKVTHTNLIRIRTQFVDRILLSAENL